MQFAADLHTHTIASSHAYATVNEMVAKAQNLGYGALAITDHGPAMPDAPHRWYYGGLLHLPDVLDDGFLLLKGVEANVMEDGELDMAREKLERMDWVIASMHESCIEPTSRDETTEMWLKIAEDPLVDMIGHCEQADYPFDHEPVVRAFAEKNKVVEMNAGSRVSRPGNEETLREIALCCKKHGAKIAVNSDAHSTYAMDNLGPVVAMLEEIGYPEELVVNTTLERLMEELRLHGREFARRVERHA